MARFGRFLINPGIEFAAGSTRSCPIPQGKVLAGIIMVVEGTCTVTGGSGAGTVHADAAYRVAQNIVVKADGQNIFNSEGGTNRIIQKMFRGSEYTQDPLSTDAAGTAETIKSIFYIPFRMPKALDVGLSRDVVDRFALPTRHVDSPTLHVTWGNASDLVFDGDFTSMAFSNMTVTLWGISQMGTPDIGEWYNPLMVDTVVTPIAASGNRQVQHYDKLASLTPRTRGGRVFVPEIRALIYEALDQSADGYRHANSLLTELSLNVNNADEFRGYDPEQLQEDNLRDYRGALTATEAGVYVIDAAADDLDVAPGQLLTLRSSVAPYTEFNWTLGTGTNRLRTTILSAHMRVAA